MAVPFGSSLAQPHVADDREHETYANLTVRNAEAIVGPRYHLFEWNAFKFLYIVPERFLEG
jgi:hypothetical protein